MAEIGLQPGGDDGTWFQKFTVPTGPEGTAGGNRQCRSGFCPGRKQRMEQSSRSSLRSHTTITSDKVGRTGVREMRFAARSIPGPTIMRAACR